MEQSRQASERASEQNSIANGYHGLLWQLASGTGGARARERETPTDEANGIVNIRLYFFFLFLCFLFFSRRGGTLHGWRVSVLCISLYPFSFFACVWRWMGEVVGKREEERGRERGIAVGWLQ